MDHTPLGSTRSMRLWAVPWSVERIEQALRANGVHADVVARTIDSLRVP